jgi:hypothetical protein
MAVILLGLGSCNVGNLPTRMATYGTQCFLMRKGCEMRGYNCNCCSACGGNCGPVQWFCGYSDCCTNGTAATASRRALNVVAPSSCVDNGSRAWEVELGFFVVTNALLAA